MDCAKVKHQTRRIRALADRLDSAINSGDSIEASRMLAFIRCRCDDIEKELAS
jgi:hypothetical protein